MLETYITHLRILEFSSNPTSPPPPQSRTPQSEKPRVIIVAVRKSGRVRVHKTKENLNGSFSIGKTWNLDDLSAIESFTGPNVAPDYRQRAGDSGFVVTLGKPYYWEAQTDREKKFFIASLIKIYGKYTGGRVPVLSNFDQRELDQVLGGATRRTPSGQTSNQPSPALTPTINRPPPSPARAPVSASPGRFEGNNNAASDYTRTPSRSPMVPNNKSSPASLTPSIDSSRNFRSQDPPLRQRLAINNGSQDSVSPANKSGDEVLRPRSRGRPNGNAQYATAPDPSPPALAPAFVPTPSPSTEKPPERKRPPMDPLRPTGLPPDDSLVPAPLSSMAARREPSQEPARDLAEPSSPVAPPPRSIERMSPRKPALRPQLSEAPPPIDEIATKPVEPPPRVDTAPLKPDLNGADVDSPTVPPVAPPPSESPAESPVSPEEDNRPGLGPMIRARKPKNELAGALWKAATAANVFKPRAGGAGEKLRQAVQNPINGDGPDGITAVVPAPKRPEPEKKPESRPETPEIPEVKVSKPDTSQASSIQDAKPGATAEAKKAPEPKPQDERKRSVTVGNDLRYLNTLGVDPSSILDKKTSQFTEWLDFFSWVPGDKMRSLHFDEMKIDLDRELNKAQAGGWLARFEEEDERVDGIKIGLDNAMEECEELDNLLTLYGVELSVSTSKPFLWLGRNLIPHDRLFKTTLPTSKPKVKVYRSRLPTKNCSKKSWSRYWRPAPLLRTTCKLCQWRLWTI